MKEKITREMVIKEGFAHRGNAIVIKNKGTNQLGLKDLNPNTQNFDVIGTTKTAYGVVSVFAEVFVKFPNKYVRELSKGAQGPINSLIKKFNEILEKSKKQARAVMGKTKQYTKFTMPFSIFDLTKMMTSLIDKIFGSIGHVLKPRNPN